MKSTIIVILSIIVLCIIGVIPLIKLQSGVVPIQNNKPSPPLIYIPHEPITDGGFILTDKIRPNAINNVSFNTGVATIGNIYYNNTIIGPSEQSYVSFDFRDQYKKITLKLVSMQTDGNLKITSNKKTLWEQDISIQNIPINVKLDLIGVDTLEFSGRYFIIVDPIIFPKE